MNVSARPGGPESYGARFRQSMRGALRVVLDLALPQLCPSCREPVSEGKGLCAPCWSKLSLIEPPYCMRLGIPFAYDPGPGLLSMEAIANPPAYNRARAVARYDDVAAPWYTASNIATARPFTHDGPLDGSRWPRTSGRCRCASSSTPALAKAMGTTIHQSAVLARTISAICGVRVTHGGLRRIRATPQQVGRSRTERVRQRPGGISCPA